MSIRIYLFRNQRHARRCALSVRATTGDRVRRVQGKATEWGKVCVRHGQGETAVLRERRTQLGGEMAQNLTQLLLLVGQLNGQDHVRKYRTPAAGLASYPALLRKPRKCDIFGTDSHFLRKMEILVPCVMRQPPVTLSARVHHPLEKRPFSSLTPKNHQLGVTQCL